MYQPEFFRVCGIVGACGTFHRGKMRTCEGAAV